MLIILDNMISLQKRGEPAGIPSICSAHPWVIKTAMRRAAETGVTPLVEATCNQVNQFGGYTGMTPRDFADFIRRAAADNQLDSQKVLLGGDHLGPSVWQDEPEHSAMEKSKVLVEAYVRAGFTKIHLDASMRLGDDSPGALDPEVSTRRTAILARAAEDACQKYKLQKPRYVIGTEVPLPGGAKEHENQIEITNVAHARETIELTRQAFFQHGLEDAWERVIALVVQPGVEFGDDFVLDYRPEAAVELKGFIETVPGMVYEAHSTDYQTHAALRLLKRDHFSILKVGPALTFAFREAVFELAMMENELVKASSRSNLIESLDEQMILHPEYWQKYYHGDEDALRFARKFSFSDRSRYYWGRSEIQTAIGKLFNNLNQRNLPLNLISQYDPAFYSMLRDGKVTSNPESFIEQKICTTLADYDL